jgi:hypothetical protein
MKPYDDKAVSDTQTSRMKLMTLTWTRSDVDVEEERRGSRGEAIVKLHLLKGDSLAPPKFTGSRLSDKCRLQVM